MGLPVPVVRAVGTMCRLSRLLVDCQPIVVVRTDAARDAPQVVQTWFQWLNPLLADRPPALLLRAGEIADIDPKVLAAVREFPSSPA